MAADPKQQDDNTVADGDAVRRGYWETPFGRMEASEVQREVRIEARIAGGGGADEDQPTPLRSPHPQARPRPRTRPLTTHVPAVRIVPPASGMSDDADDLDDLGDLGDLASQPTGHLPAPADAIPITPRLLQLSEALGFPLHDVPAADLAAFGSGCGREGLGVTGVYRKAWADGAAWARHHMRERGVVNILQALQAATLAAEEAARHLAAGRITDAIDLYKFKRTWFGIYLGAYVATVDALEPEMRMRHPEWFTSR